MAPSLPPLTDADRARVAAAVTAAEANTAGEIVPVMAALSDDYADVALAWAALAAFACLAALAVAPGFVLGFIAGLSASLGPTSDGGGGWDAPWAPGAALGVAAVSAMLVFLLVWSLLHVPALRLAVVPGAVKHRRVRARAIAAFQLAAQRRTIGATGVLVYLSRAERRAEIVADETIAARVEPEVWGEAMAAMLSHIGDGRLAEGVEAGIAQIGAVLAEHCPRLAEDTNELPDRLIEL